MQLMHHILSLWNKDRIIKKGYAAQFNLDYALSKNNADFI